MFILLLRKYFKISKLQKRQNFIFFSVYRILQQIKFFRRAKLHRHPRNGFWKKFGRNFFRVVPTPSLCDTFMFCLSWMTIDHLPVPTFIAYYSRELQQKSHNGVKGSMKSHSNFQKNTWKSGLKVSQISGEIVCR